MAGYRPCLEPGRSSRLGLPSRLARHGRATLEPERGGVAHTRRRAQAVPGEGKDRRGCTARVQPARHGRRPADVSASTARCCRARRGQLSDARLLLDQMTGKITPPITRTTSRPRISRTRAASYLAVGLHGLTAFRWRGRPSPFRAATASRRIKPMALAISNVSVDQVVDKVCRRAA